MLTFYLSVVESESDRQKIIHIYENYYSFMSYTAGQVLKDRSDVEDAVHNAMMKIIESLEVIDISNSKRAMNLCGIIARNKAIDLKRSRRWDDISLDTEDTDIPDYDSAEDIVIRKSTYDTVLNAILTLDDVYRDVCILKYVNELKEREIALLLDITPKAVNSRVFRGKQILREALRKEGINV